MEGKFLATKVNFYAFKQINPAWYPYHHKKKQASMHGWDVTITFASGNKSPFISHMKKNSFV